MSPQEQLTLLLSIGAVVSLVAGWVKVVRPKYRRVRDRVVGAWDSIFGRDAIVDSTTGRVIEPALPGVGMRLASTEEHLVTQGRDLSVLTESVATLVKNHARLDSVEGRVDVHDEEIAHLKTSVAELEAARVERIVGRVESAAAFRAMEQAIKAEPDHVVEPEDD